MKFNLRIFKVLFKKDLKNCISNKNIFIVIILPVILCGLYSYIYSSMDMLDESLPKSFALIICSLMLLALIPINILATMVAEEKEKNTLRSLMLSNVSSLEFLSSKVMVCETIIIFDSILMAIITKADPILIVKYLLIMILSSIGLLFFGAVIGIVSKNQMSAGTLASPIMILLIVPPMFADINKTVGTLATIVPTTSMKTLFLSAQYDDFFFNRDSLIAIGICLAWVVIGAIVFRVFYKKRGLDD